MPKNTKSDNGGGADELPTQYERSTEMAPTMMSSDAKQPCAKWDAQEANQQAIRLPDAYSHRFTNVRLLGRGGAGAVFSAYDAELDRTVALKALQHPPANLTPKAFAQQEARAMAHLHHPGIVTLYDWIASDNCAWLILEHVPGRSLAHEVHEHGPLSPAAAFQVCLQVCAALQYAHEQGIWHLDIKPGNVLRNADKVKVTDFGIAYRPNTDGTGPGWGTKGFAPPEQLAGKPVPQSDVYAIAALMWSLLTGDIEHGAASVANRRNWRVIPVSWRPVLRAALSVRPENRPATPAALAVALQRAHETDKGGRLEQRAWNVGLVCLFTDGVAVLLSGRSPLAVATPGQVSWLVILAGILAWWRPESAVLLVLLLLVGVLVWHIPTLGVMMAPAWPLVAFSIKHHTRPTLLVLITPLLFAGGWASLAPLLAGTLMPSIPAALACALGLALAEGIAGLWVMLLVQSYISLAAMNEQPSLWLQAFNVIKQISPRDILLTLWPGFWRFALAPGALWLALTGACIAAGVAWGKGRLRWTVEAAVILLLLLVMEGTRVYFGGAFSNWKFALMYVSAILMVKLAPGLGSQHLYELVDWIRQVGRKRL